MLVRRREAEEKQNSKSCTVWEYTYPSKLFSFATALINGRYPDKGQVANLECEEIYYAVSGKGIVHSEFGDFEIEKGDSYFFKKAEKYWVEGNNLFLVLVNAPPWFVEQHKNMERWPMKIGIVSSAGGHLIQCLRLMPVLKKHDVFIVTFTAGHLKKSLHGLKTYLIENPKREPIRYLKDIYKYYKILKKEKPDVIISTGAGVAVPFFLLAKYFFGSKTIFIESFSRITKPSQTGQILYHFADLFIVQWKPLLKHYDDKAVYGGLLL